MANKLVAACPDNCSFHEDKIGKDVAEALLSLRQEGYGGPRFTAAASRLLGRKVPATNVQRHLKHYREVDENPPEIVEDGRKIGDLEILDTIIASGARNSRNWKPTIKDTLDAMKLKLQITGNSAFEDMLAAMEAGLDLAEGGEDEDEEPPENPAALGTPDEAPSGDDSEE